MLKATFTKGSWFLYLFLLMILTAAGSPDQNTSLQDSIQEPGDTAVDLNTIDSLQAAAPKMQLNKQASAFAKDFVKSNRETLQKVEERSKHYFDMIDSVFTKYDLPVELKYLAVIESKLKPTAVSRCGAVGLWQFMPSTAKTVGLKISNKYDERKYSHRSTVAAAKYLRKLHNEFGDWLLVIAAYNAGPGNVYKAIKRSGSRDFWKLQYHLPKETRLHVKRFIGTHYYFEEEASLVVLTKTETTSYLNITQTNTVEKTVEK